MSYPDWESCILDQWGWPSEVSCAYWGAASNVAIGTNPAYAFNDFLALYPKFFGVATAGIGNITSNSPVITGYTGASGAAVGQLITGTGIPAGTTITGVGGGNITMSQNATATQASVTFSIYAAPPLPLAVISLYIILATASLQQARWCEMWQMAMGLFVAHYCTLYLRSEGNPGTTPGQIAMSGMERGMQASKSVGPVSVSNQFVEGLEDFGSFRETTYGTQLATFAKVIGSGGMVIY